MCEIRKHLRRLAFWRRPKTRTATVTITADTSKFNESMRRLSVTLASTDLRPFQRAMADAAARFAEAPNVARYRARIHRERLLARVHLNNLMDAAYADLGLDRNLPTTTEGTD